MTTPRSMANADVYRFRQGDFDVTVLSDGFISVPTDIVLAGAPTEDRSAVASRLDGADGVVFSKCNIPVIRKGRELILVDIGAGDKYQPSDGKLPLNLLAADVSAEAVTKIVFTHAHPDHIWATLLADGALRFPNATYYIGSAEWDFWMDPDFRTKMPSELHGFADGAQRDLTAISDRVVMLQPGDEVVTGLSAIDTAGHTPGHLSFELAGGDGLIITADAATNEIVSFEHPEWVFGYDTLPELAIRSRETLLDRAAKDRTKLLGYHWTYPGVGFAERRGDAFVYVPDS
ncbi:MBL fold metallo-hydrolase [Sphingomonas glacialis]|uniref:MBL fold metallo-hydrolase n=1 Tax=Sphingomonas glacialis TaxID=658225 RepID=A0A502G4S2_9SPHN|nr:MBL fold metallo-hydrolase [Sphingomonas glacialis]TPG56551.1 MBL fold metallo-hydrolase [Sphingomonas glacialis]